VLLGLGWFFVFVYHERYAAWYAISKCEWSPNFKNSTNVMLIADPQLIDNHTYPGRNEILLKLSKHTVDMYLKRNYQALIDNLNPDHVIFLGDYLDNGRSSSDEYYAKELSRFNQIFYNKKIQKSFYEKDQNWFINLPGNHDIGFGDNVKNRDRFIKNFGNPNQVITIRNVDFIAIDSLSYSSEKQEIQQQTIDFIDNLSSKSNRRILLSHIPLYRQESQTCGPLRESRKPIKPLVRGYQYQTTLDPQRTNDLLTKINPNLVFSGDDHDFCEVIHQVGDINSNNNDDDNNNININNKKIHEFTVKSISMAMGIKYPAVQLLSFEDHESSGFFTSICYTQTPYVNIASYMFMTALSTLLILWWNIKQRSSRYNYSILPTRNTSIAMKSSITSPTSNPPSSTILSSSSLNSRKISNFLKDQDNDQFPNTFNNNYFNIPAYTSTSLNSPSFITKLSQSFNHSKFGKFMNNSNKIVKKFVKKWNIGSFLKHCICFGLFIISLYYFGFCLTI
jgi:hypothetical protein